MWTFLFCMLTYIVYIKCTQELTYVTIWSIFWNVFNLCEAIISLRKINIELQISENVFLDFRQIHTVFIVTYIGGSFYWKMMNMTTSENRQHRGPKTVFTIRIQNEREEKVHKDDSYMITWILCGLGYKISAIWLKLFELNYFFRSISL